VDDVLVGVAVASPATWRSAFTSVGVGRGPLPVDVQTSGWPGVTDEQVSTGHEGVA
jgi:hypothetical protein